MTLNRISESMIDQNFVQKVNDHTSQLAKIINDVVSPDSYTGTDFDKLQAAINYAQTNQKSIKLDRLYDITGLGTLMINKPDAGNRTPLIFQSFNRGGIKKTDSGIVFSGSAYYNTDIWFNDVYFESVAGAGTKIFKCPQLIRMRTNNCFFKNVDTIYYTDPVDPFAFIQSVRSTNDNVLGGNGYAFDFNGAYDMVITNLQMEGRQNGILHREIGTYGKLYNVRIKNSVLQGFSGEAMHLGASESLVIDGCYFEANVGGHINFTSTAVLAGVKISNCYHGGNAESGVTALIKWGIHCGSVTSENNVSAGLPVHDTTNVNTGHVVSRNDSNRSGNSDIDTNNKLIKYKDSNYSISTLGVQGYDGYSDDWGGYKVLFGQALNVSIAAGVQSVFTIRLPESYNKDDLVAVKLDDNGSQLQIISTYFTVADMTKVRVVIKNPTAGSLTFGIFANVFKSYKRFTLPF